MEKSSLICIWFKDGARVQGVFPPDTLKLYREGEDGLGMA